MYCGLIISIALSLILTALLLLGRPLLTQSVAGNDGWVLLVIMIPCLISSAVYTPFRSYLMGREMFYQSSMVEFVEQILRIIVFFIIYIVCQSVSTIYAPAIAMSIAGIASTILGIMYYKKAGGKIQHCKSQYSIIIKRSTPITLVKLLSVITMPLLTIVMPLLLVKYGYSNQQALSELGIVTGMTLPLLSIPGTIIGSLAVAILPSITTLYANNKQQEISRQVTSAITFTLITTAICVPIFFVFGQEICNIIFGNEMSGILLEKSCWIMIPMGVSQITTTILNSIGYEKHTFVYYLIGGMFLTIVMILLSKYLGIMSFIYALATNCIIISLLNIFKISQHVNIKSGVIKDAVWITLAIIATILLGNNLSNLLNKLLSPFINICIISIIMIFSFFALLLATSTIKIADIKRIKLKKKNV